MGSKGNTWTSMTVGDLVTLNYGESLPERKRKQGKIPVYGSNGITGYHNQALVPGPGIIVGRKGTSGAVHYCKFDYFPIDTTFYITPSENYDLRFVYYLLKTLELDKLNFDSAVPGLNRNTAYSIPIKIPQKQEQQKIASILGALDDKIELNHEMNRTLEEMAQTIFKHWFMDFEFPDENGKPYKSSGGEMVYSEELDKEIPKGWGVKPFSEVISVNPQRKLKKGIFAKKVGMPDLDPWQSWIESWQIDEFKSGSRFQNGDILFARITPSLEHGKTALVTFLDNGEVAFGTTEFIVFAQKIIRSNVYIVCLARSEAVRETAIGEMTGSSGRQRVPNDCFDHLLICLPTKHIIDDFNTIVLPLFEIISSNAKENQYLVKIRDALLPKLLSGEIRVQVNNNIIVGDEE